MTVKVIVTRAEPGQAQTARNVVKLGFTPIVAPMLHLYARDVSLPDLSAYGAILFTSANGVRFFSERVSGAVSGLKQTVFCVGPTTLAAAREKGFSKCEHANGDALDLAELVKSSWSPMDGKLLHIANAAATGDLAKSLRNDGFDVDFVPLYAADPAREPLPEVVEALAGEGPVVVLVHSAKAAEAFKTLYKSSNEARTALVAMSEKAAAPLADFGFADIETASRPNEAALMAGLHLVCARL